MSSKISLILLMRLWHDEDSPSDQDVVHIDEDGNLVADVHAPVHLQLLEVDGW